MRRRSSIWSSASDGCRVRKQVQRSAAAGLKRIIGLYLWGGRGGDNHIRIITQYLALCDSCTAALSPRRHIFKVSVVLSVYCDGGGGEGGRGASDGWLAQVSRICLFLLFCDSCNLTVCAYSKRRVQEEKIPVGPLQSNVMGAVRALPSKFGRRSGPCHGPL